MYIPAARSSINTGIEVKPYQKPLIDRLRDLAEKHNLIASELEEGSQAVITSEQVSTWFYEGNPNVWSVMDETTLYCFPLESPIREFCINAMLHSWFDRMILLSIIGNALFLAADNPLDDNNKTMFAVAEFVFNSIFLVEFCIKLIALGGTGSPAGYFLDPWNRLDFTVLVLGWLPFLLSISNAASISNFTFIRAIRILKVLKTVNNVPGLKRLVKAVLDAIPRLISVGYLLTFIFLLFGILGTQLYMGRLRQRCFPKDVQEEYGNSYDPGDDLCSMDHTSGLQCHHREICRDNYPGTDKPNPNLNPNQNFDNTPNSFLSIFVLISLEGWASIMYEIMDTAGEASAGYFVFLVFVGSYFVINLLIAVIYQSYIDTIDEVHSSKADLNAVASHHRRIPPKKLIPPLVDLLADRGLIPETIRNFFTENALYMQLKYNISYVTESVNFHWVIVLLILFNIIALAIEANGAEGLVKKFVNDVNTTCTILFVIELVIRIIAEDITKFFRVGFNVVDTAIVIVSVAELFTSTASSALSAFRTLRVFRTFKLLSRWESLQQLVYAVFKSGPGLGYFCIILFLYIFVCALAGMSLFAGKLDGDHFQYGTSRANYDTLFQAFVSTFQVVSGENWSDMLFRGMEYNPTIGGIYYVIVYGIGNLIVLNLFLAILLENFSEGRYRKDRVSYYEQLDHQRDVQVVISTVAGTFSTIMKRKVWVAFGYMLCQNLLPVSWSGDGEVERKSTGEKCSQNDSMSSDSGEFGVADYDADNERDDSSVLVRSLRYMLGRKSSSASSFSRNRTLPTHPAAAYSKAPSPTGKALKHMQSKWGGWDSSLEHENEEGSLFLQEDAYRRAVLGDIVPGQYRRGNQYFNDCFMAVEVVDILLDRQIVNSIPQAIAMGQELVFRRKLLPVYIMRNGEEKDDDVALDDEGSSVVTPYSNQSSATPPNAIKPLYVNRKISANTDIRFSDDRSLYRLGDQGEQVTEWLMTSKEAKKTMVKVRENKKLDELNAMLEGVSFGLFFGDSAIRRWCGQIVIHKYTEIFVVGMIIASSLFLALDEPGVKSDSVLGRTVRVTDLFFTSFFVLEMLVKMIAMGVYYTPQGYFKSEWNILDFIVVAISVLSISLKSLDLSFLKAFRALRALRPLRVVSRSPGMRAVVNAIILVVPPLTNFVLVVSVFLFTFAILGASMFRDHLYSCKASGDWDSSENSIYENEFRYTLDMLDCTGNVTNSGGYVAQLEWKTAPSNFDNIGNALLTLFELSTMEGWPDIMYPAMDIVDRKTHHPVLNNSRFNAIYFIAFIIVGAFFITNLFVGIIVHKFNKARILDKGSVFLTEDQQQWLNDLKVAMSARPQNQAPVPTETDMYGLQRPIYYLVQNPNFILVMDVFILLNILLMTLIHYNQPDEMTNVVYYLDIMFVGIFGLELLLRFLAVGLYHFSKNNWNRFDFLIVLGAVLDVSGMALVFNVTIFRVLRIGRILRLVKSSKNLIVLLKTLFFSLPSLLNVGSLLFLAFFVFTIVGMNVFGTAERDGELFTEYNNFEHFGTSMLLLFRCMTGENWNDMMHYLQDQGYPVAVPYFALFLITCRYMMLNLFIAVILENFEAALAADPDKVQQKNLEDFIEVWAQIHDELGAEDKDRIPCYALVKLIHSIPPPLGIKNLPETDLALGDNGQRQLHRNFVLSFVRSLDLKEDSKGRVYFVDVIAALVRRSQSKTKGGTNVIAAMSNQQRQELLYRMRKMTKYKTLKKLETKMKDEVFTEVDLAVEFNSAMAMQAMWRGKQSREKLRSIIAQMVEQHRNMNSEEKKKHNRRSLRKIIWNASKRSMSSSSFAQQDSPDSTLKDDRSSASRRSNSSRRFFMPRMSSKRGSNRSQSEVDGTNNGEKPREDVERKVENDNSDEDQYSSPPIAQLEFQTSRPISARSEAMCSDTSRQSSWLAPLRSPFSSRPASFRREASQISGISGITLSSWESAVDRKLRKQKSRESVSSIREGSPLDDGNLAGKTPSPVQKRTRPSLFLRHDSRAHWLPTEAVSSRTILSDKKPDLVEEDSNNRSTPLKRSRTLSSLPTSLAQLTGMSHFLMRQDSSTSRVSVDDRPSTPDNHPESPEDLHVRSERRTTDPSAMLSRINGSVQTINESTESTHVVGKKPRTPPGTKRTSTLPITIVSQLTKKANSDSTTVGNKSTRSLGSSDTPASYGAMSKESEESTPSKDMSAITMSTFPSLPSQANSYISTKDSDSKTPPTTRSATPVRCTTVESADSQFACDTKLPPDTRCEPTNSEPKS